MTSVFGFDINMYMKSKVKKIYDHKYITALQSLKKQFLEKQVNGDINMKGGQIRGLGPPTQNNDSATKDYVDHHLSNISNDISNCVKFDEDSIDIEWKSIQNVRIPMQRHDAISKFYLAMFLEQDDINLEKLIQIAEVLEQTIQRHPQQDLRFFSEFCTCLNKVINLKALYHSILIRRGESKNMRDLWRYAIVVKELKAYTIILIENLDAGRLTAVEEEMTSKGIIRSSETDKLTSLTTSNENEQSDFPCKRFKRFLNKLHKQDRRKNDLELEILLKRNLLILDLGFVYIIERLLDLLVHEPNTH